MDKAKIAEAVVVAAEVLGHELSPVAAKVMARALDRYDTDDIGKALNRCTVQLKGRLTLAAIIERMPGQHVGAEEAWALCPRLGDEATTVVWTDEIAQAYGVAAQLGEAVSARMAFKETYLRLVAESQESGGKPVWRVSLGHDDSSRSAPILRAVEAGRIPPGHAEIHLEGLPDGGEAMKRLGAQSLAAALPSEVPK